MLTDAREALLSTIYAAAVEPETWPAVLERLSDAIGGGGGALIEQNQADGAGDAIVVRLDDEARDVYFGFETRNVLLRVENPHDFMRSWAPRILTDEDWMPKADLVRSEYYDAFLHPRDMHSVMMIRLARRGLETAHISIGRSRRRGAYSARELETARVLHPHLIHAFALGQKVAGMRGLGEDLSRVLDRSAHGVVLIGEDGRVGYLNRTAERLTGAPNGVAVHAGRLCASGARDDAALQLLIGSARCGGAAERRGGSIAVPRPPPASALTVTVSPAGARRFGSLSSGRAVLVCITDPDAAISLPAERLRELYGLTPAETRIALCLFEGRTQSEVAAALGLSVHTVRVHVARIFAKTRTNRQAELMLLMIRSVGPMLD